MDKGFIPFFKICPDIAPKETKGIINMNTNLFPDGKYLLMENYCNDKSCDCRKVIINVVKDDKIFARIGYGW